MRGAARLCPGENLWDLTTYHRAPSPCFVPGGLNCLPRGPAGKSLFWVLTCCEFRDPLFLNCALFEKVRASLVKRSSDWLFQSNPPVATGVWFLHAYVERIGHHMRQPQGQRGGTDKASRTAAGLDDLSSSPSDDRYKEETTVDDSN